MQLASAIAFEANGRCLFRSFLPLSAAQLDQGTNSGWAHVAMLGTWEGHSKGSFAFTQAAFDQILKNFSAQRNPIPWDYEHDTFNLDTTGPKPASGWVKRLELRASGTELWAYVDWTPRAAQMIRDGEYRFCSPVVDFESIDRKSNTQVGAELLSVALTNNPFLDGQHPIQLTWVSATFPPPDDKDKDKPPPPPQHAPPGPPQQSAEPKGPPPQQQQQPPEPKPMAAPGGPPQAPTPAAAPGEPPPAATDPNAADAAVGDGSAADANALLTALADMTGLDKTQTLAALLDMKDMLANAIQKTVSRDGTPAEAQRTMSVEKKPETQAQPPAATDTTTPAVAVVAPPAAAAPPATADEKARLDEIERQRDKERLAALEARLNEVEAERKTEKSAAVAQLVDDKIASGHIRPEGREDAIWAFTTDRARAERMYADKLTPIGVRQSTTIPGAPGSAPTAAAKNVGSTTVDMSQFSSGERLKIECLKGARKTEQEAVAIVMSQRNAN